MSGYDIIVDLETYPNCFLFGAKQAGTLSYWQYEISDFKNDNEQIIAFLDWMRQADARGVGFNSIGFDYPIIHMLYRMKKADARVLYDKAQAIIGSQDDNRWLHIVYPQDRIFRNIDLYLIHHFDNRARATSLKALQFNMGMKSIQDLPFPVGTVLDQDQILKLREYHIHDLDSTDDFFRESKDMIRFREELSVKYQRDFMNHNDTKIGKDFFIMELEKAGIPCYDYSPDKGRTPRQTRRSVINLGEAILPNICFENPDLQRVCDWLRSQSITQTKGSIGDLTATINGFTLVFGLGGIHGSVENQSFHADDEWLIVDLDVASMYPNISIANNFFPAHLSAKFCEVYKNLYEQRKGYKKGTPENAMLKLALNGVYGDSNNGYSPFCDPLYTMKITLNGQLQLCKLVEMLFASMPTITMIQANTDGVTFKMHKSYVPMLNSVMQSWQAMTGLTLEKQEFKSLHIRDVNNYIGIMTEGKAKRKGAYEYMMQWHQDASALVVPKVAEQVLLYGKSIRETVESWPHKMDFMLRVKVPRTGYLTRKINGQDYQIQNTTRYYVAVGGTPLTKWLPPLAGKHEWRQLSVEAGWTCCVCNDLDDAVLPIDYSYYVKEIEKLVLGVM